MEDMLMPKLKSYEK